MLDERGEQAGRDHERAALMEQLAAIREELLASQLTAGVHGSQERDADRDASARNLLQYLALRRPRPA